MLVFDGASYAYVVVAVAPVGRQASVEAVDAFGEEKESAVAAQTYDVPYLAAPWVGLFYEKVGGETQGKLRAGRIFPVFASVELQGHVERAGASHLACGCRGAEGGVLAIDIAVSASGTYLVAAVPGVPHRGHWHCRVRLCR